MVFDWGLVEKSIPLLATGLVMTLKICALAMVFGTILGALLGLASLSRLAPVRWTVIGYVDFIRGTPLLIQIFLVYFALPVVGINLPEFWAGVIRSKSPRAGRPAISPKHWDRPDLPCDTLSRRVVTD